MTERPSVQTWLRAARLRTLPLAFAVIALGSGLAFFSAPDSFSWGLFALALFTAFSYQVLSNYANDLGDGLRGTDANKHGEQRAIASGAITVDQMRGAVRLFTLFSLASGTGLSLWAFADSPVWAAVFTTLGLLATWAARSYTMGGNPYAYWGGGDLFVFLFFGLVGVVGSALLYVPFQGYFLLPAAVAGALSAAVLTLNNLRDEEGDRAHGKRTLVVRNGQKWGRRYLRGLLITSSLTNLAFALWMAIHFKLTGPMVVQILLVFAIRYLGKRFKESTTPEALDGLLKPTAMVTLLYCVLMAVALQW